MLVGLSRGEEARLAGIAFSEAMKEFVQSDELREGLVKRLSQNSGAEAFLGEDQIERLQQILMKKEWDSLDRFPGLTVSGLGRTFRLAGIVKAGSGKEDTPPIAPGREQAWPIPSKAKPPAPNSYITDYGLGLLRGDRVDMKLAPSAPNGAELARMLNELALDDNTRINTPWGAAVSPRGLVEMLMKSGHQVEVRDARYFANFGDLIYKDREVITPFWIDTGIEIPAERRTLHVPVGHSQHELHVQGPALEAHVAFYFGIDGKAVFRVIDTLDQTWVQGRVAHLYTGEKALEVISLAGQIVKSYKRIQTAHPELPFAGYYALGVCNDVNAIIELKMQGRTTLYPLTLDHKLFSEGTEVDRLARMLPVDHRPTGLSAWPRIRGSLPVTDVNQLMVPGLAKDLLAVEASSVTPHAPVRLYFAAAFLAFALWVSFRRWM